MAEKTKKEKKKTQKAKVTFKEMNASELSKLMGDIKKELQETRFKMVTGSVQNVKKISQLKKDYARAITFLKQKEKAAAKQA